jgi:hypothetical protein
VLDTVSIASPCNVSWDSMKGDDRVRFCGQCKLNVFNLSALPRAEAEALVQKAEGRVCVRLYRRTDGTVITQDCSVVRRALTAARRRVSVLTASLAAFLGLSSLAGCEDKPPMPTPPEMGKMACPTSAPTPEGANVEMGDIAAPVTSSTPTIEKGAR